MKVLSMWFRTLVTPGRGGINNQEFYFIFPGILKLKPGTERLSNDSTHLELAYRLYSTWGWVHIPGTGEEPRNISALPVRFPDTDMLNKHHEQTKLGNLNRLHCQHSWQSPNWKPFWVSIGSFFLSLGTLGTPKKPHKKGVNIA